MKTSDTHAFVNQLLVCLLVTISFGGSIGLGAVWLRHQISLTANSNRLLQARIAGIERRLAETNTAIEGEQGSDVLRRRNTEWHLGFVSASDAQVVRVTDDPAQRLASRRKGELLSLDGVASAASVRVALKN